MKKFNMGNRAYAIVDMLFKSGIVSGKSSNQPRKVIPQLFEDMPEDVMELLLSNGYSGEVIADAFCNREGGESDT